MGITSEPTPRYRWITFVWRYLSLGHRGIASGPCFNFIVTDNWWNHIWLKFWRTFLLHGLRAWIKGGAWVEVSYNYMITGYWAIELISDAMRNERDRIQAMTVRYSGSLEFDEVLEIAKNISPKFNSVFWAPKAAKCLYAVLLGTEESDVPSRLCCTRRCSSVRDESKLSTRRESRVPYLTAMQRYLNKYELPLLDTDKLLVHWLSNMTKSLY